MLIIGSQALKFQGLVKDCLDLDLMCNEQEFSTLVRKLTETKSIRNMRPVKGGKYVIKLKKPQEIPLDNCPYPITASILEIEIARDGNLVSELLGLCGAENSTRFASLDILYTLKCSHKYLKDSPHFDKTRNDILFLESLGFQIPKDLEDWYSRREAETYNYALPNLDTSKDKFFNKQESFYQYDHDDIHLAVALREEPAYIAFLADNAPVKCDKEKFFALTELQRLSAVVEESMVLALERSYIPNKGKKNFDQDKWFEFSLRKVCTSITSGWFREYAWKNFDEAIRLYKFSRINYVSLFEEALTKGEIKDFQ